MKILMYSPAFYPGIGGLEAVVAMLAEGLAGRGCDVKVVTTTPGDADDPSRPYEVVRSPSATGLLALVRWCDVFFHHNVSLKGLWPLLLVRRPWVVLHHGWYTRSNGKPGWQDRLKHLAARFATNISVSRAVAAHLDISCTVIPNPYRDDLFRVHDEVSRNKDMVFLGRLVSDKGCSLLLDALAILVKEGIRPGLTVIGSGPEEQRLREQASLLGLAGQVEFAGGKSGEELVQLLNEHTAIVVPSVVSEGFGLVALEGIACGCVAIASDSGGLPEAVGPCGIIFPNGDVRALADRLAQLVRDPESVETLRSLASGHLRKHFRDDVACRYLAVLEQAAPARIPVCKNGD